MLSQTGDVSARFSFISSLFLVCTTALLASCGGDVNPGVAKTPPPTITAQPQSISVISGQTATFSVTASGAAPLSYQWEMNGTAISGANTSSFTTPALQVADSGAKFSVVVSNSGGMVTSSAATVTVTSNVVAPTITVQPAAATVAVGATATFTVVATGTAPLSYQWEKNGVNVGTNSASYTTPALTTADSGETYTVVVSNASSTTATSNPATLTVTGIAPTITTQPTSQTVPDGSTASFTVVASGSAPLTYQWYKNGVAIGGATLSSYTTPATVPADSGAAFTVVVNNSTSVPATSSAAILTITHTLALLAGELGGVGHVDATGSAASFYTPEATATDAGGNVYVVDQTNQLIRMITPAGVVTTLAGTPGITGATDGACATALFNGPSGIALDTTGNIYIADTQNDTIRKITMPGCTVSTLAGTAGTVGSVDGTGAAASFAQPNGLAVDTAGTVFVADTNNDTIRKVTAAGVVTTLAGTAGTVGVANGTGAAARFNMPMAVAVDGADNLYVADYSNSTIRKVTAAGVVTTFLGTPGVFGHSDGTGAGASFDGPTGVALDSTATNLYVADPTNGTIRQAVIATAVVTTIAGTTGIDAWLDGTGTAAELGFPVGLASDTSGNLYVADADNNMVRKITTPAAVVTTLAGNIGGRGYADGTGGAGGTSRFDDPHNVASDGAGSIFVGDRANNVIRKIAPGGTVTTFAGTAGVTGSADGTGPAASFSAPFGMAFDSHGNLYVADSGNNTIRMITPAGVVSTFAGTAGVTGSADGTGPAAKFNSPYGLAIDAADTLYLADYGNNVIRKITTPGAVVTTLAGTAGAAAGTADGTGPAAQFASPHGLGVYLATGDIYVADRFNDTIRMITPAGVVTTIAGTPGQTDFVDGTGAAAHFDWPGGVSVDQATGNLYVSDYLHNAIREIAAGNVVTTVVGTANSVGAVLGDLPGALSGPSGLVVVQGLPLQVVIGDSVENSVLLATLP